MEIEVIRQTTIISNINSPINKSELKKTNTNNIRIILSEEINETDIEYLANFAKPYIKTWVIVSGNKIQNFDFLHLFPFLYGFQIYGLNRDRILELNKLPLSLKGIEIGFLDKKASLKCLINFEDLEFLSLSGNVSDIEDLAKFNKLKELNLYYIKSFNPSILSKILTLKKLTIHHGSILNNEVFTNLKNLESIDLWKIRGLDNISWIKDYINLISISIGALSQIETIPSLKKLNKLQNIKLEQLKGINDISPISQAKNLKRVHISKMNQIPIESYQQLSKNQLLTELTSGYSSKKKREEIEYMLGIPPVTYKPN